MEIAWSLYNDLKLQGLKGDILTFSTLINGWLQHAKEDGNVSKSGGWKEKVLQILKDSSH
jgi:hypothetical protein